MEEGYIVGIDPGINYSSIVFGKYSWSTELRNFTPLDWRVLGRVDHWVDAITNFSNAFDNLVECNSFMQYTKVKVAIEYPVFYQRRGMHLIKQCINVGAVLKKIMEYTNMSVYMVNNKTAKLALSYRGTSNKDTMLFYCEKHYPQVLTGFTRKEQETVADSVGILMAVIKKLNGVDRII